MALQIQPSAKTPTIPAEIWMHVAQFVPDTDLFSVLSVNRVFFQLSMDARYRELRFGADSDGEVLRRVQRVRDPLIAHRVRNLYINLQYGDALEDQRKKKACLKPGWARNSLVEGIKAMTETVACLTNVTEFSVQWEYFPPGEHLVQFLTAAWKSFGSGLCKLSFEVSLENLATLLSTVDGIVVLRDLNLNVKASLSPFIGEMIGDTDGEALATVLAPFVNKAARTLHTLSLCFSNLDFKPLFRDLENFPNLERLRLSFNNHGSILTGQIFAVTRFLTSHATTLRHLDWDQLYGPSDEQQLMDLLRGNSLEEVFSNLCTLRIRVPEGPGGFSLVVQRIQCSAPTLTSLGLLGYHMTYQEVETVISLFTQAHSAGNLKELGLWATYLSPDLILLFALALPRLEKLAIRAKYVTGREVGQGAINVEDLLLNARIFADTMRTHDLRDWPLRDIDVGGAWNGHISTQLMWLLAECVPSVQTFGGKNKELHATARNDLF